MNHSPYFFKQRSAAILTLVILLSSCFGTIDKRGSIKSLKDGVVFTRGGQFRIGTLSPEWIRTPLKFRALIWNNSQNHNTIMVSSFCKRSRSDGPIKGLMDELFIGMTEKKTVSDKEFLLDGRLALSRKLSGKMDGLLVQMQAVVQKRDDCTFDFVYVATPKTFDANKKDFDALYNGFRYVSGPALDD